MISIARGFERWWFFQMGRGRAKAKQTKVARDLKYGNGETDLTALAKELKASRTKEEEIEAAWAQLEKDE